MFLDILRQTFIRTSILLEQCTIIVNVVTCFIIWKNQQKNWDKKHEADRSRIVQKRKISIIVIYQVVVVNIHVHNIMICMEKKKKTPCTSPVPYCRRRSHAAPRSSALSVDGVISFLSRKHVFICKVSNAHT